MVDEYDCLMKYARPILICDSNEEFRGLLREMLIKNGFFHVIEVHNSTEALNTIKEKKDYFTLIHYELISSELLSLLEREENYLIFADRAKPETATLATRLGVDHILSFPVHSRKLVEKINSFL
jgi:DNA-binding NtrC family response regulator